MERKYNESKDKKYTFCEDTCKKSMKKYLEVLGYNKVKELYKDEQNKIWLIWVFIF